MIDGPDQDTILVDNIDPIYTSQEIGDFGNPTGSYSSDGNSHTITGSGYIAPWRTTDTLHFASTPVSGDFFFSAKVDSVSGSNQGAAGMLMARESTDANSRFAATFMTTGL